MDSFFILDFFQNPLLAASGGRIGAQNRSVLYTHEDSSTEPTAQLLLKVGFGRSLLFLPT